MARQILFNGSVLTRPGAYTKIDASQFQNVALLGIGVVGIIGNADGGPPQVLNVFSDASSVKSTYRSGDLVEAAQMLSDPTSDDIIVTGAQTIVCYKVNAGTHSTLAAAPFTFTSRDWGIPTNSINVQITSSSGNLRTATVMGLNQLGTVVTEVSPEFGDPTKYGKFTIQYVGAGSVATMAITATGLTTTVTGAAGDNLAITFSSFNSLNDLIFFIDGLAAYTCTALITNATSFNPANLDGLTAQDIRTSLYTVMANNFDMSNWLATYSSQITSTFTQGSVGPRAVLAKTNLSGGTLGTSANSDWVTAFATISTIRINQLVPLASADAITAQGTYTIASINAALATQAQINSSTIGKNECQGWATLAGTKTQLITQAQSFNSEHVCLSSQKLTRQSAVTANLTQFPEWSLACVLAGMRAGAPLGEPLTHKVIKASAIANDASWSTTNTNDIVDFLLNGLMMVISINNIGFRIEKGITTYTKSDNDAFTEESIVQNWKLIAYQWRTALENRYVGRPMDVGIIQTVKPYSAGILRDLRDNGVITDSIVNGVVTPGFGNIQVSATNGVLNVSGNVSPTPGIDFILNTAVLVPAQFSL